MLKHQKKVKNITKDKSFLIALTVSCIKCSNVQISLHCFLEPPCLHRLRKHLPALLIRGEAHVLPGVYTPSCDEDGFYLPRQCRAADRQGIKECWCVDRHGSKIEGLSDCGGYSEMCVQLYGWRFHNFLFPYGHEALSYEQLVTQGNVLINHLLNATGHFFVYCFKFIQFSPSKSTVNCLVQFTKFAIICT